MPKKHDVCYKVLMMQDGALRSFTQMKNFSIVYPTNKDVCAPAGKLFAFTDLGSAVEFCINSGSTLHRYEIWRASCHEREYHWFFLSTALMKNLEFGSEAFLKFWRDPDAWFNDNMIGNANPVMFLPRMNGSFCTNSMRLIDKAIEFTFVDNVMANRQAMISKILNDGGSR